MLVSPQLLLDVVADGSRLSAMTNAEDAWKALAQANDWVKLADTKAGMVIAASGVLGGLIIKAIPPHEQWAHQPWKISMLLASLALVCASAVVALLAFAPRLRTGEAPSLLYFDHIARCYPRPAEFSRPYLTLLGQEEWLQESLANQMWATSTVAHRKFRSVILAIWFLCAGLFLAVGAAFM